MLVTLGHSLDLKVPNNDRNAIKGNAKGDREKSCDKYQNFSSLRTTF